VYIRSLDHGLDIALEPVDLPAGDALRLELVEAWDTATEQAASGPAVRRWRECHKEMVEAQGDLDKAVQDMESLELEVETAVLHGRGAQLSALEDKLADAQKQQARLAYRLDILQKQVAGGADKVRAEMIVRLDASRDQAGNAVDKAIAQGKKDVLDAVREPLRELLVLRHVCGRRAREHQALRERLTSSRDVDTLAGLLGELAPELVPA
jgi:hypothetical protein